MYDVFIIPSPHILILSSLFMMNIDENIFSDRLSSLLVQCETLKSQSAMELLNPNDIRRRARRQNYREVASNRRHVLSFKHHRKLGSGGWRNKVRSVTEQAQLFSQLVFSTDLSEWMWISSMVRW